jgi:hypothetical protein
MHTRCGTLLADNIGLGSALMVSRPGRGHSYALRVVWPMNLRELGTVDWGFKKFHSGQGSGLKPIQ